MRIHELSKMINVSTKEIIAKLAGLGITVKSHMSKVDDEGLKKLEYIFGKNVKVAAKKTTPTKETPKTKKKPATAKPKKEVKKKAAPKKAPAEKEKPVKKKPVKTTIKSEPTPKAKEKSIPAEQPVKEADSEKIAKFKSKPGMQRAFDSIRRVDTSKKGHDFRGRNKKQDRKHPVNTTEDTAASSNTAPRKRVLKFMEGTTVKEFSELIGQKLNDVIKKFMELGYMTTINQPLDSDSAQIVAELYGLKLEPTAVEDDEAILEEQEVDESKLKPRSPIVTIMGHVDHGKTTLLDAIRKTRVTDSEAGGITQHIGAYKVKLKDREITFLDTPGHAAFTMMRARGAKVTDIVVLVVAADDSVMPQTIEAIDHAKAANVPIVVAVNKIDKEDADAQKVQNELAQYEVIPEDWGGNNIFVEVSAKEKIGIEQLLEMILLQADMMELKADYDRPAKGTIVEAKLDKGRGPVGTVLVNSGTLKAGDSFLVGTIAGRVRALVDDQGKKIKDAGPSTPVEVIGFPEVPQAGDIFTVMADEKKARQIAVNRLHKQKNAAMAQRKKLTLDDLFERVKEGEIKDLNIIIKADVQGSVEAVKDALLKIKHPEVKVNVIHTAAGGINESDVMLAAASNAIIIGFSVRPDANAAPLIEKEVVDVRLYNIIYEAIEDIKKALEGLLEPTITEKIIGKAEVRDLFNVSRVGTIAGCHVIEGKISRSSFGARVIRDSVVIYESKISSLKRFKDDAKEVLTGFECGIMIENFNDLKQGDIIENYIKEEIAGKLE
ncbi:MAG TPA: translation initiation factor IF-2 [Nitrospirae bacterium]|nr:translation initiation factor IF-2 [bacterium BMS3Bbin09]HDN94926.1 translation initiation factor IF-2 [Nitrospirota bacterium]HDO67149.1 translation initiation factor IF-2 [Nitrospirota bacterium]HEW81323.1 translation initiation factor IF-2 [Nitrospirota bacterium]